MAKKRDVYTMSNGQPVTEGSVSALCGIIDKSGPLVGWAAKMVVHALGGKEIFPEDTHEEGLWKPGVAHDKKFIELALADAKNAHRRKKDTAGDLGTEVHAIVGAYVEGQLTPEGVADPAKRKALENFILVTQGWEWLGSEVTLINEWMECPCHGAQFGPEFCVHARLHGYGGTADALARINGQIHLIDFKTSNSIHATYTMQCALYAAATPTNAEPGLVGAWREIQEARILHFHKDLLTWESLERNIKEQMRYIPHFIGCTRWKKKFDQPTHSTYDGKLTVPSTAK